MADLTPRLEPWPDGPVEHLGSIAGAGVACKPAIDLMVPVTSLARDA